ncbi:MAG TPA: autotransporter-associated beta strand repeat-containing protein, partial [Verrucomicrobiae bacterium]
GIATHSVVVTQNQGDVVVDGGVLNNGDGWRVTSAIPGSTMRLAITNGGTLHAGINFTSSNIRVGFAGGDNSANNILDVAGLLNVAPNSPLTVNGNSAVSLGQSGANCYLYLRPGGRILARSLYGLTPANSEAHFLGGTLTAIANEPAFIANLTAAYMEDGGLTIDTTNYTVTVTQPLLAAGNGGLTKVGSGTLTLSGADTYTGDTLVNAGKLILGPAHAAMGNNLVAANATLAFLQSAAPATVNLPLVNIGTGTNSALEVQLTVTNAPAAIITNLVLNGVVAVNVSGQLTVGQIPLFGYGTISGAGGLNLGKLPLGTVATLVTNTANHTIDLLVTAFAQTQWVGNQTAIWDLVSTNWTVLSTPVAYAQSANVLFNDSALTTVVALGTTLTPGSVVVSNNAQSFTFSGSGSLSGSMTLVKDGTNSLTLSTANSYTGNSTLKAGRLILGNNLGLGSSNATLNIQSGATLDLVGNVPGLKPLNLTGSGMDGNGALVNDTTDQNDALRAVTLTGNTVIRADALLGIRTPAETDPGFIGNGFKLTKTGTNQLNLNGGEANTLGVTVWDSDLGDVDVKQGILSFQRRMTMGRVSGTVTVEPGASLYLFDLNAIVMPLQTKPVALINATLAGNGVSAGDNNVFGGPIFLSAGTNYIQALTDTTLELLGTISGAGGFNVTSSANGRVQLGGTNTYTGATWLQSGTLVLENSASISNTSSILLNSGTTLDVSSVANPSWVVGAAQTLGGAGNVNGSIWV